MGLSKRQIQVFLLLSVTLADGCVRPSKGRKDASSPDEIASKPAEPDRPTEENEGIPGYLTDPGAVSVTNFGPKLLAVP